MCCFKIQQALIEEGFPDHIAYYASLSYFMNCNLKPKKKDWAVEGRYTKRLHQKVRDELSFQGLNTDEIDSVIELLNCMNSWCICQDMARFNGCVKKTFKELLEENKNKEEKE